MSRPLLLLLGDSLTERAVDAGGWACLLQQRYNRSTDVLARGLSGYNTRCATLSLAFSFSLGSPLTCESSRRWFVQHALPVVEQELRAGALRPALVTLWLGANDAARPDGYAANQHVPLADYRRNLRAIVGALQAAAPADCCFLLITPPPVDDAAREERIEFGSLDRSNDVAGAYAAACVEEAQALGVAALDVYSFFNGLSTDERNACLSDGLHFSDKGNRLVDEQLRAKIASASPELQARMGKLQLPLWRDLL